MNELLEIIKKINNDWHDVVDMKILYYRPTDTFTVEMCHRNAKYYGTKHIVKLISAKEIFDSNGAILIYALEHMYEKLKEGVKDEREG